MTKQNQEKADREELIRQAELKRKEEEERRILAERL